jgi:transposase
VAKISRELEIDEKTTRKYLARDNFSPKAPEKIIRPSRLDPFKTTIDSWLEEDKKRWYKQRHRQVLNISEAARESQISRKTVEGYGCLVSAQDPE